MVQPEITKLSTNSGTAKPILKGKTKIKTGNTKIANKAAIPHAKLRFFIALSFVPKPINKNPAGDSTK
jgi:hypothetical protein